MKYTYKAITKSGEKETGNIEADNKEEATTTLRRQGIIVTNLKSSNHFNILNFLNKKVPFKDKILLTRQLAIMIKSGLPVVQALEALEEQSDNPNLKKMLTDVTQEVKGGSPLSKALAKFPTTFTPLYTNVIESGEKSGKLEQVLENLADQQEKDYDIISKVKSAMIYPMVILVALLGVAGLVVFYIIPQMSSVFIEMGVQLPLSTRILIFIGESGQKYYYIVLPILIVLAFLVRKFLKTPTGIKLIDNLKLKFPVLGTLNKKLYMARFTRTMAMLISAGLPMLEVIKTSGEVINNTLYQASFARMSKDVENGMPLSKTMQGDKNFPPMVYHMLTIGEQSGKLDYVLDQIANFYEKEVDSMTKNLSSLIEPLLMVLMGIGVGFVVISVLGPITSITQNM